MPLQYESHTDFFRLKVTWSSTLVSFERALLVKCACQIWIIYLLWFKRYVYGQSLCVAFTQGKKIDAPPPIRNIQTNIDQRLCVIADCFWLSRRHHNMWAQSLPTSSSRVDWLLNVSFSLTSHSTIFQLYMRRHVDMQADWRKSWTYDRAPTP